MERWRWLQIERAYPHLDSGGAGRGALITPVLNLIEKNNVTEGWGVPQRAALRSAICRGQWPQARLAVTGLAASSSCKFCLHEHARHDGPMMDVDGVNAQMHGDEFHRVHLCSTSYNRVRRHLDHHGDVDTMDGIDEVRRQAGHAARGAADARPESILPWTRALVPMPRVAIPSPSADGTWEWHVEPSEEAVRGTVYPDASLLDGPSLTFGRFGWSFVIVQGDRREWEARPDRGGSDVVVLAAAFGATPAWIQSMPAAEAWALLMATRVAAPSVPYITDCLENVRTLRKGPRWATAPGRVCARVWSVLMAAFDNEDDRMLVEWMPSHLSAATASQRRKSDGTMVTEMDRKANQLADVLAKRGAATHRVPAAIRHQWKQAVDATHWLALTVGYFTWAANNNDQQPRRDAEPDQGWTRSRQRQRRQRPRPAPCQPRPVALGGHRLAKANGCWKCDVCRSRSVKWASIAPRVCPGAAAVRWAARARELAAQAGAAGDGIGGSDGAGHVRFMSDDTTWCDRCGSYADAFAVGLARICPGRPTCAGKEQHLRRLRRGRHPVTNLPFHGPPVPEPCLGAQHRPSPPPPQRREAWGTGGDERHGEAQTFGDYPSGGQDSRSAEESRARAAAPAGRIDAVRHRLLRRLRVEPSHPRVLRSPPPPAGASNDVRGSSSEGVSPQARRLTEDERDPGHCRRVRRRITGKAQPAGTDTQWLSSSSSYGPRDTGSLDAEDPPHKKVRRLPPVEVRKRDREPGNDDLLLHAGPPPPQLRRRDALTSDNCVTAHARGEKRARDDDVDALLQQRVLPRPLPQRRLDTSGDGYDVGPIVREPLLQRSGPVNEAVPLTRRELLARLAPASGAHIASPVAHGTSSRGKSLEADANAPAGHGPISSRAELIARLKAHSLTGNGGAASSATNDNFATACSKHRAGSPASRAAPPPACDQASCCSTPSHSHRDHCRPHADESNYLRSPASACSARACAVSHVQFRIHRSYRDHMASARSDASVSPRDWPD